MLICMFYQELSDDMKKYVRIVGMLLFVGLMLSSFAFAFWYAVSALHSLKDTTGVRQIAVSGEGKVAVKPDITLFNASVITEDKKIGNAQSENTRRSNDVLAFLKQKGIAEKDMKSAGYSIYPQYQYDTSSPCYASSCPPRRPPEIVSYQVRHTIEVKVRDLAKVDDLLEGVVTSGANEIGSVAFTIENETQAKEDARKEAIDDAAKKARVLAKDLHIRLGSVIGFSESGGGVPAPLAFGVEAYGKGGARDQGGPEVQPGEQEIKSFVTVVYEFR